MTSSITPERLAAANARSRRLRELILAPEILVMPGAWDTISAQLFESMGFPAIQGSSGALANAFGYADGEVIDRDDMVDVYRRMVEAVAVPVNADGEKGYGTPDQVSETVRRLVEVGAAGMNLEDSARRASPGEKSRLIDIQEARDKVQAVMDTKRALGSEFFLNARVDALGAIDNPEDALAETIARGNAYAELGADCIFIIRAGDAANIRILAKEISAPISILAGATSPSPRELEELGVARVSYGSSFFLQSLVNVKALAETVLAKDDPAELLTKGMPGAEVAKIVRQRRDA